MSRPKTTENTNLQNLRQDLSRNVDAMLQFTDKGFCRVILSPESRASCNAAFIESFQLPSSPSIAPGWMSDQLIQSSTFMRSHVDSEAQVFLTAFGLYPVADHPVASCCFAKVQVSLSLDDICNSEEKNLVSIFWGKVFVCTLTAYFESLVCFDFKIKIFGLWLIC